MALISQIRELGRGVPGHVKFVLAGLGAFGAALFFGDSMITPAISVLLEVEGTETISSSMASFVIPITVAIVVTLFAIQRHDALGRPHVRTDHAAWSAACELGAGASDRSERGFVRDPAADPRSRALR